jgi:hypothetical protein
MATRPNANNAEEDHPKHALNRVAPMLARLVSLVAVLFFMTMVADNGSSVIKEEPKNPPQLKTPDPLPAVPVGVGETKHAQTLQPAKGKT